MLLVLGRGLFGGMRFFPLQKFDMEMCFFCLEKLGLNCIDGPLVDKLDVEAELDIKPGIQGKELNLIFSFTLFVYIQPE